MKKAKPARAHKSVERTVEIKSYVCGEKTCAFYGKAQQQGVCHTTTPFIDGMNWDYVEKLEAAGEEMLAETKRIHRRHGKRGYIRALESHAISAWMQQCLNLDELVGLRRRVALLQARLPRKRARA